MLEFIVLGLIPGTSIQITFAQVLVFAAVLLICSELFLRIRLKQIGPSGMKRLDKISV